MSEKNYELINCKNYFNENSLNELITKIDSGEKVGIYIDCIGHTRNYYETQNYVTALKKHYGDKLVIDTDTHWYTLYYVK